jgi:hypothetical protein
MLACIYGSFLLILHFPGSRARERHGRGRTEKSVQAESPSIARTVTHTPTSSPGPRVIHRQLVGDLDPTDGEEGLVLATFRHWKGEQHQKRR